ncbi:MAG: NADH-quinone oxidoreductase subunit D [Syntrophomonadaceae bacterium]|nr:NADH-quinone oxidoreductase subunit D [Syntrophomonadaceae bacterium]
MSFRTIIPFGPQHPVFPEPIQLKLAVEDEKVVEAIPGLGYVHRGLEKGAELNDYVKNIYLAERVCGICSFIHSWTYCSCIETLLQVEVPPRAEFLRLVFSELSRVHSHLLWLGLYADAFGFESLFMQCWRVRERSLDMQEAGGGGRVILSTCTIGGMRKDLDEDMRRAFIKEVAEIRRDFQQIMTPFFEDYSIKKRTVGIGVLTKEDAQSLGAVGPVLRASGVAGDTRLLGYGPYREVDFEPVVEAGGDCHSRGKVRVREVLRALDLITQALERLPEGEIKTNFRGKLNGEVFQRMEQPRGEMLYYVKAGSNRSLDRFRIRTPTFANIPPLLKMLPGCDLADVPVIVLSIDPCISCAER